MTPAELLYVGHLLEAIERSDTKLKKFCERRMHFMAAYTGDDWGELAGTRQTETAKARAINMMFSAISVLVPVAVAQNPLSDITTDHNAFRPGAYELELVMDQVLKRLNTAAKMRHVVTDMMFGAGIGVVGLGPGRTVQVDDESFDLGAVFFDRVSLDRYFFDPEAETRDDLFFEGHTYEMPYEFVMDNADVFTNTDRLAPDDATPDQARARARDLSGRRATAVRRIVPTLTMRHVFLRPPHPWGRESVILTCGGKGGVLIPLQVAEWHGPERGPYEMLGYLPVPDNVMPMSPAAGFSALDDLINTLARKLYQMAKEMKTVLVYETPVAKDAEAIAAAAHGQSVGVSPGALAQMTEKNFLGPDQGLKDMLQWLVMMFSRQAGNIEMLGGLSADARTATEASLLQGNANFRVGDIKGQLYGFMDAIFEKIAYFIVRDLRITSELKQMRLAGANVEDSSMGHIISIPIPGLQRGITRTVDGDRILGNFIDYNFRIKAYSMDLQDPQTRVRKLMDLTQQIIIPLADVAAQQGAQLNVAGLVENIAQEMNIDLIDEVFVPGIPTSPTTLRSSGSYTGPAQPGPGSGTGLPQTVRAPEALGKEKEVRSHAAAAAP